MLHRRFLLASAGTLVLSIAACGGDAENGEDEVITPEGAHYGYVVSKATVIPASPAGDYGLDLGSSNSTRLDGRIDNKIGGALGGLSVFFDVQGTITEAIDQGSIILLVDMQSESLASSDAAGLGIKFGAQPQPPACADMNDTTCRRHLSGSAAFQIAPNSPTSAALGGRISGGTFTSSAPGSISLQLALGTTQAINLDLVRARARATGISETGVQTIVLGGLLTTTALTTQLGPALKAQVDVVLDEDCTSRMPCTCSGTASTVLDIADTNNDCQVSVEELLTNSFIQDLLQPDSCTKDSCGEPDALSIGLRVEAVKATFPQ